MSVISLTAPSPSHLPLTVVPKALCGEELPQRDNVRVGHLLPLGSFIHSSCAAQLESCIPKEAMVGAGPV